MEVFSDTVSPVGADGNYDSGNYTTTAAGSYFWVASFSGDSNNDPASTTCGDAGETSVVNKAKPSITTTTNPASGKLGVTLNDTANLSEGYSPTGTITFQLYAPSQSTCTGTPAFTQVVTVNGNGSYSTTGGFVSNRVGTWRWTASYSGDSNNNTASSGCDAEQVTISYHPGTIGFWKNWRNHFTKAQFQILIDYLKENNRKVYKNTGSLTIAKVDAIFNLGSAPPRDQKILAQLTGLKFNLAVTQLDGTGGIVQKNDDIYLNGVVDVSGISGATAFFGTSTPTIRQVVDAIENRWIGQLTTSRADWKFNLTNSQKDMVNQVLTGINEGTIVTSPGSP